MVAAVDPPPPPISPPRPPSPTPTPQRPVALRFSNYFIAGQPKAQSELDFVDVLLDTDIRLYVDPFAFKIEPGDWFAECHNLVVGFFQELIDVMKGGDELRARSLLNNLHEPNEVHLGLSRGKSSGRGLGEIQTRNFYDVFARSKAVQTGILHDLSDCELFIERIGHDKISDIATNIIRWKLVEFTQEQCRKWSIPMASKPTGPYWDDENKEWRNGFAELPVYDNKPIILVPKRAVRFKMAIDDREYFNHHVVVFYQGEFAKQENINSNVALARSLKHGRRKVYKKDVKDQIECSKDLLREFSEEHPEVLERYKEQAEDDARLGKHKPSDAGIHERVKQTAHDQSKILIEELILNVVNGSNYGVVGTGNRVYIGSITVWKDGLDKAENLDAETRDLLKQAIDAIEAAEVKAEEKEDAKENLDKLSVELNSPAKEPGRIRRFLNRITEVLPPVATILTSGKAITEAVTKATAAG